MTTGEGGMLVTNSRRVADDVRSLANQGRAKDMRWLDHKMLGYNYRLDEMSAALGRVQLERLKTFIAARRQIAAWYDEALAAHADIVRTPKTGKGRTHTYFVYVVQIMKPGVSRDNVMRRLQDAGVQTKPYLPSIHLFTFYRKRFGFKKGDFPVAESISARSIALPMYLGLTRKDVSCIVSRFIRILRAYA